VYHGYGLMVVSFKIFSVSCGGQLINVVNRQNDLAEGNNLKTVFFRE